MAKKEIVWEDLTREEEQTLADLKARGIEVCAAPVEIEHADQLETLGITWAQVRTWHIGATPIKVHLTPSDPATAKMLLDELRDKHRKEYRQKRCQIPGILKPTIFCPDSNRCSDCPFPEYRDQHRANNLSWETLVESGYEEVCHDDDYHGIEVKDELEYVCKLIGGKNPKHLTAIVLKEYHNLSVKQIAEQMNETERNVRFYIDEAKKVGRKYKQDNQ